MSELSEDKLTKDQYNVDHNQDLQMLSNVTYDELEVGRKASISRVINENDVKLFAIVSGDVNPTHFDIKDNFKKELHGYGAHQMINGALVSNVLGTRLPGPGTAYVGQSLTFSRPIYVGDKITVTVTVREKKANSIVSFDCECINQKNEITCQGIAEVKAPTARITIDKPILPKLDLIKNGQLCKQLIEKARALANKLTVAVVYPCSDVALLGAYEGLQQGLINPLLIGPELEIKKIAKKNNIDLTDMKIIDVDSPEEAAELSVAKIHQGEASALMKGSLHTSVYLKAILDSSKGLRTKTRISHCCVMDIPNFPGPLLVSDIAINIAPDLTVKKDIVQNAIYLARAIGVDLPKVALLCAEESVSVNMPATIDAAALCKMAERGQIVGGVLDGPLAFDVALAKSSARIKKVNSVVSGEPDILIAPTIESANILAKQLKYFTHALMPGLVLGAKAPAMLTSRADNALTRAASCALAALYVDFMKKNAEDDD